MGFKNVMKKIGKIALTAAPYVAAPFTGGASLMATGLANKAVQKWSEHDAKDAIAHGLEPSSFDRVLGKVGGVAGLASSFIPTNALGAIGMLGKAGKAATTAGKVGQATSTASKIGKVLNTASKVGSIAGPAVGMIAAARGGQSRTGGIGPSQQAVSRTAGDVMPRGGYRYNQNPMNQLDQSSPNLSQSIFQGRQEAIKNQPYRKGYDVTTQIGEPDEEGKYQTQVSRMPQIFPNTRSQRRDEMPPRRRRPSPDSPEASSTPVTPRAGRGRRTPVQPEY